MYHITGPQHTVVFLPDIDNWEPWEEQAVRIEDVVASADVAYLDAAFYRHGEVPGRAMSEIAHPFIEETMRRFAEAPTSERTRIRFIHLNRTNPAAFDGAERTAVERAGFRIARMLRCCRSEHAFSVNAPDRGLHTEAGRNSPQLGLWVPSATPRNLPDCRSPDPAMELP